MYSVLLVDDEALIREAISENTKWNELGFELAGTCKNGREAMEFIRKNPPDLLLTDICMPYMDGMELAKYVYEEQRDTKVVIISGYDEFEYAKKAVKYQVAEYILKPITAMELSETLKKVRVSLDEERMKEQSMQRIRGAYVSNLPLLRGRFLNGLLAGSIQPEELEEKLLDYHIPLSGTRFMSAIIMGDNLTVFQKNQKDLQPDLACFAIYNIADEIISGYQAGVTFQDIEERTIILFGGKPGLEKKALKICEEIQGAIGKFLKIQCTIAVGLAVNALDQVHLSCTDMKKALEYRFLLGGNQVIYADSLRHSSSKTLADVSGLTDKIVLAVKSNQEEEIVRSVQEFMQAIQESYVSRNRSIFYVQNAVLSLMNSIDTASMNESVIFQEERELLNSIYTKNHLSEVAEDLTTFCVDISRSIQDQKDSYCKRQALLAQDYIEKNYGNPDITLNTVCTFLSISTSYFSSVFKAYTGETFIEALTKKRMEKAKSLIENTSKKTYEVAAEVGYSDPHYFSSTFKKVTGMTPTEYAKKVR